MKTKPFALMAWTRAWLWLLLCACSVGAHAQIYLVVSHKSPVKSLNPREAQSLYMGRSRTLPSGDNAMVLDLPRDSEVREQFYQLLTGMSPAQVNSYWSRLMFTGQTLPPQSLASEALMAEQVKRNALAVGYLSQEPTDPNLRTVLVLRSGAR